MEISSELKPLISIILPIFNGQKFMAQSIESCLNQTYKNIELIIVNDCSTDNSLKIAQQYEKTDNRIKIINNLVNKKLPASLNIGHRAARGSFITWTSDDNWYEHNSLEQLYSNIAAHNADVAYSNVKIVNTDGVVERYHHFLQLAEIIFGNVIGSCFLYKKEMFDSLNGYNEALFLLEDYDFWLRAVVNFKFKKIDLFLYNYRKHPSSLTAQIRTDQKTNQLFVDNTVAVYKSFFKKTTIDNGDFITEFAIDEINYRHKTFLWHKENFKKLSQAFIEISNNSTLSINDLKKLHLKKIISSVGFAESFGLTSIAFIFRHFILHLKVNDIKIFIRHAFKI